jgi:hypothetical protein
MSDFLEKAAAEQMMPGAPRKMTTRDRLEQSKRHLEAELSNVNAALKALDDHPDIDKVLELVSRAL